MLTYNIRNISTFLRIQSAIIEVRKTHVSSRTKEPEGETHAEAYPEE
jgi:hypothetical protein